MIHRLGSDAIAMQREAKALALFGPRSGTVFPLVK
jgi:hypothetical protein